MVQLTQNHPHVNLRVKFKKLGSLQYISHLDLVRTMNKIVVRAGLPLWYTEGFNPKPKMTFAAPLSIGTESVAEYMDIKLVDDMPPEEIVRRLNENMTDEMQVLDAYYTDEKLTRLRWLSYRITVNTLGASAELAKKCEELFDRSEVLVAKKAKAGEEPKLFDVKPLVGSISARYDEETGRILIDALLSADPSAFLNPEYVVKALRKEVGILSCPDITRESWSIMRLEGYLEDMSVFR